MTYNTEIEGLVAHKQKLERELGRAYRALGGLYSRIAKGEKPDDTMLGYHSLTIAAALRFVKEGSLEGSDHFEGKAPEVLQQVLRDAI